MNDRLLTILKETNAIITESHIVYTSGLHGSVYFNKDAVYPHTKYSSEIGQMFAESAKEYEVDVVVGPALGGIILSQWTAYHLSKLSGKEILGVYTEKDAESNQIFKRGYDKIVSGKKILVLEDIVNTGGSVKKVIKSVEGAGGKIVAVGIMVNRKPEEFNESKLGLPFISLLDIPSEAFEMNECPMCKENVPINTSVGHGKKFLERTS